MTMQMFHFNFDPVMLKNTPISFAKLGLKNSA